MNTAVAFAHDVADRLHEMPEHPIIQPRSGNQKYVGFDATGQLRKCTGSLPGGTIVTQSNGLTEYSDPYGNGMLYMYDNNTCSTSNPSCFPGAHINSSGNAHIDPPNTSVSPHRIHPVRFVMHTTFYAVWSITYLPCGTGTHYKRKIFITVYWIDPEPEEQSAGSVETKLHAGEYTLKSVSLVIDKVIGSAS